MIITAGIFKGRKVVAPDEKIARPTLSKIRESVFSCLFSLIGDFEGKIFLDMFAGSGIMGLEAISRGFEKTVAFEKNKKAAQILKQNYTNLGIKSEIIIGDSLKLIDKVNYKFDVIYIDPPYQASLYEPALKKIIENNILNPESIIILEHDSMICTENLNLRIIKQKKYSDKFITFLQRDIARIH